MLCDIYPTTEICYRCARIQSLLEKIENCDLCGLVSRGEHELLHTTNDGKWSVRNLKTGKVTRIDVDRVQFCIEKGK